MKALAEQIADLDSVETYGRVVGVRGLMVEVAGPIHAMSVGARLTVETAPGRGIPCEVVGFSEGHALAMPFAALSASARKGTLAPQGDRFEAQGDAPWPQGDASQRQGDTRPAQGDSLVPGHCDKCDKRGVPCS